MLLRPALRGRGMGTIIFRAFVEWAAAHGARDLFLSVKAQNERATRFWNRMGFTTVETRPLARFGAKDSIAVVMRHELARCEPSS